jgi:L-galactose dehydrogenase
MQYTTLGKTGLRVSVAGLGCGGNSKIGLGAGLTTAQSVDLVRAARDLGVTFYDTAEAYGTEEILGAAFTPAERASVVISTKSRILTNLIKGGDRMSPDAVVASLEASLRRLRTDYVDVFLLHGVKPTDYEYCETVLLPALRAEQTKGKVRHLGLSETAPNDPEQRMLQRALAEPAWADYMLAFHMLNQGARRDLFPRTSAAGVGTLLMFVVRNIFSQSGALSAAMRRLADEGKVPADLAAKDNPLDFLLHAGGASSLTDAAYRFARHQPGADVVLFGTSKIAHLKSNIDSILAPPLPPEDVARLHALFGTLRGVGLDAPNDGKSVNAGAPRSA